MCKHIFTFGACEALHSKFDNIEVHVNYSIVVRHNKEISLLKIKISAHLQAINQYKIQIN